LTDFIKGAPSATAIHQANDQNAAFRDTKAGMETVTRNGVVTENATLAKHVKHVIVVFKVEHPEVVLSAAPTTDTGIRTQVRPKTNKYRQLRQRLHQQIISETTSQDKVSYVFWRN
jgi:hypothetical protein